MNEWVLDAVCRQIDPTMWFPEQETDAGYAAAIGYCQTCPVMQNCLAEALHDEAGKRASGRHGVYGGKTPQQRAALDFQLEHGTVSCYVSDLCRCSPCVTAYKAPRPATAALAA